MTYLITEPLPHRELPRKGQEAGATAAHPDREDLALYQERGGYAGLALVRAQGGPWAIEQVAKAGLRGRGGNGTGEPLADKWRRVAKAVQPNRYAIANGAESMVVSQKDRYLLTYFPHRVLEGLLIAATAIGAQQVYLYVRGDSDSAVAGAKAAVAEATAAGLLGGIEVEVQPSAPTAVSGEATALIDSLEGLEGLPQPKPPQPEEVGLRGLPTLVQNVESLAAAAALFRLGPDGFLAVGTPECPGTALFTVDGAVARPGVYEVPFGTSLAELLAQAGAPPTEELLAVLPGGLGSGPLRPDELSVPLTYEALASLGSTMGTSAILVFARAEARLAEVVRENIGLMREASCGQCRGCKDGHYELHRAFEQGDLTKAQEWASLLHYGRGNCALPTGTARFALRALQAFSADDWAE